MNATGTQASHGVVTRVALVLIGLAGAFMIAMPLASGLPGKLQASADLMTAFRPVMSNQALAQNTADQQTTATLNQDMSGKLAPALASQLHLTGPQLALYLAANYPALTKLQVLTPSMQAYYGDLAQTMSEQQANYQQADQIPTAFLPPTSVTWLFIVPGAILFVIGVLGLARPAWTRPLLAASGVVGLLLVAGLLAVSMYPKAAAADNLNAAFQPVFSSQSVHDAASYAAVAKAAQLEVTNKLIPNAASAFHMTPAQFNALLAQQYPSLAKGLAAYPSVVSRMGTTATLLATNVDNYNQTATIPWSPGSMVTLFWLMMGPAAAALLFGAGALVFAGRRPAVVLTPQPHAPPR